MLHICTSYLCTNNFRASLYSKGEWGLTHKYLPTQFTYGQILKLHPRLATNALSTSPFFFQLHSSPIHYIKLKVIIKVKKKDTSGLNYKRAWKSPLILQFFSSFFIIITTIRKQNLLNYTITTSENL